jgi:excinuclease UvrABC nuclease subunit
MIFRKLKMFNREEIRKVPGASGVYLVYIKQSQKPFYIGRSRCDIRRRLFCHLNGIGSKRIKELLLKKTLLRFEWEELISVEQTEAILIRAHFNKCIGNMRKETDPADTYN